MNFSDIKNIAAHNLSRPIGIFILAINVNGQLFAADIDTLIERPSDKKLKFELPVIKPTPSLTLPPVQPRSTEKPSKENLLHFTTKQFKFVGNTIFSDEQLTTLINQFLNTPINAIDMEELRLIITNYYINHGYINSGALFPDQNLEDGMLVIKITEGRLSHINLSNAGRLKQDYVLNRMQFEEQQPLNLAVLQNKLYSLQQNPRIKRINASLLPGERRGESILDLLITEEKPYRGSIEINNHKAPSIGEDQLKLNFSHNNLSGAGDFVDVNLSKTQGLEGGSLLYTWPLNARDATLDLEYNSSQTRIIDFSLKGIESKAYGSSIGVTYPIYQSIREQYVIAMKLDQRHSETLLDGTAEPLDSDCPDGKCDVTALRLTQSWLKQYSMEVFAFRHTLSFGRDAFGSTITATPQSPTPDSEFITWLFQYQWAKRQPTSKIQSILRADLQISNDALMNMEKFALGGANTVRGYRENEIVRDNGLVVSLESRVPIDNANTANNQYHLAFFYDYGKGWNTKNGADNLTLNRFGLGLRWAYTDRYQANLYWAKTNDTDDTNCNDCDARQDKGVHFQIKAEIF